MTNYLVAAVRTLLILHFKNVDLFMSYRYLPIRSDREISDLASTPISDIDAG